jgi:hypothetical protein
MSLLRQLVAQQQQMACREKAGWDSCELGDKSPESIGKVAFYLWRKCVGILYVHVFQEASNGKQDSRF